MAYDIARSRVVLFGGWNRPSHLFDTWEWDGITWTLRAPTASPPARFGHGLAYDSVRNTTTLFGGATPVSVVADTWEWDGISWAQRAPAASPSARYAHAAAYDSARGRVVVYGGDESNARPLSSDLWEWDGTTWTKRVPNSTDGPVGRKWHALAYDSVRGKTVLFGGAWYAEKAADTWEYGPLSAASYGGFGVGCQGSTGVPIVTVVRFPSVTMDGWRSLCGRGISA